MCPICIHHHNLVFFFFVCFQVNVEDSALLRNIQPIQTLTVCYVKETFSALLRRTDRPESHPF